MAPSTQKELESIMYEDYISYGTETHRTVKAEESGRGDDGIYIRSSMQSI